MKDDVKSLTTEYETLRLQYLKLQDKHNDILHDTPSKRIETTSEKSFSFKEPEAAYHGSDSLLDEIQRMKRDVTIALFKVLIKTLYPIQLRRKDEELFQTKRTYKPEITSSRSKLRDTTLKLGGDDYEPVTTHL